jgi:hypothetical protein
MKPVSKKAHMRNFNYLLIAAVTAIMLSPWFVTLAVALPKEGP